MVANGTVSGIRKSSGLAALAAVLALAVPGMAAAQEDHGRGGWHDRGAGGGDGGGWRGQQAPQQQQQAPQQQRSWSPPQVQQQAPQPQVDRGNRGWGGGNGGWRTQAPQQPPQPQADRGAGGRYDGGTWQANAHQQAPQQAPTWSGRRGAEWQGGQSGGNEGWRGRRGGDEGARGWRGNAPEAARQQPQEAPAGWQGRNRTYVDPARNDTYRADRGEARRDGDRGWNSERRNDGAGWHGGDRWRDSRRDNDNRDGWRRDGRGYGANDRDRRSYGHGGYQNWNRDWRRDSRYDWQGYRSHNRSYFELGYYYSPYRNYSYRRLGIGFFLDSLFYSNRYWIDDPWQYRLPSVYGPYRWVRYYDDVMLVDVETGEVVDVIYDFFW